MVIKIVSIITLLCFTAEQVVWSYPADSLRAPVTKRTLTELELEIEGLVDRISTMNVDQIEETIKRAIKKLAKIASTRTKMRFNKTVQRRINKAERIIRYIIIIKRICQIKDMGTPPHTSKEYALYEIKSYRKRSSIHRSKSRVERKKSSSWTRFVTLIVLAIALSLFYSSFLYHYLPIPDDSTYATLGVIIAFAIIVISFVFPWSYGYYLDGYLDSFKEWSWLIVGGITVSGITREVVEFEGLFDVYEENEMLTKKVLQAMEKRAGKIQVIENETAVEKSQVPIGIEAIELAHKTARIEEIAKQGISHGRTSIAETSEVHPIDMLLDWPQGKALPKFIDKKPTETTGERTTKQRTTSDQDSFAKFAEQIFPWIPAAVKAREATDLHDQQKIAELLNTAA